MATVSAAASFLLRASDMSPTYCTSHKLHIWCTRHRSRTPAVASAHFRRSCIECPAHGPTASAPIAHRPSRNYFHVIDALWEKKNRNEKMAVRSWHRGCLVLLCTAFALIALQRAGCKTPRRLRGRACTYVSGSRQMNA